MKKTYMTPKAIDFSIEGMTGIGAGICNGGAHIGQPLCDFGTGASNSCIDGDFPTSGCTHGNYPHEPGEICLDGLTAGTCCDDGGIAAGGYSVCHYGTSAKNVCSFGASGTDESNFCADGSSNAHSCKFGDNQLPFS